MTNTLQPYATFKPTSFDYHIAIKEKEHWLVAPVFTNRDADLLTESNWATFTDHLHFNYAEHSDFELHRFNHWGLGWFELIILNPKNSSLISWAENIASELDSYPVLNEEDYSDRQYAYCKHYISNTFPELSESEVYEVLYNISDISENICYEDVESTITALGLNAKELCADLLARLAEHPWQALQLDLCVDSTPNTHLKKINTALTTFLNEHSDSVPTLRDTEELAKLEKALASPPVTKSKQLNLL